MSDKVQAASERARRGSPPVLLSKIEALEFAASQLDKLAADTSLMGMIVAVFAGRENPTPDDPQFLELKRAIPEPEIQERAAREAASAIREIVLEDRLRAARMASANMGGFK